MINFLNQRDFYSNMNNNNNNNNNRNYYYNYKYTMFGDGNKNYSLLGTSTL